jgi:Skp family chaperone for outer membrane proteins
MNKRVLVALGAAVVAVLTGCHGGATSGAGADIGLVDVTRITTNWPKFLNYQNQLNADAQAIQQSHASNADKSRELAELNSRFQSGQTELTNDVRSAAQQVATDKHLKYVLTQQFVGYGGVDITPDVEKILNITERATPAP